MGKAELIGEKVIKRITVFACAAFVAAVSVDLKATAFNEFDFKKKFAITPNATLMQKFGDGTLAGYPLLVKIDPTNIEGFSYGDLEHSGRDFAFTDENGALLPFRPMIKKIAPASSLFPLGTSSMP